MNIRNLYSAISVFVLMILLPFAAIFAQDAGLKAPALAKGQRGVKYVSQLGLNSTELQIKDSMANRGYTYRKDKDLIAPSLKRLWFEKNNFTVEVTLRALNNNSTEVFIDKLVSSEIVFDTKDVPASLKDAPMKFPKYSSEDKSKSVTYNLPQDQGLGNLDLIMETPVPPDSKVSNDKVPDPLMGVGGAGTVYESDISPKKVEDFYRAALKKLSFKEKEDWDYEIMKFKRLRFESNSMAVDLYLSPRGEKGSRFIVVKYMDKNGMSKIEANPLYMAKLPDKDNASGSDLEDVPRPTDGVRQSGGTEKDKNNVSYITPLKVLEVLDFYKQKMPSLGWKMFKEVDLGASNDKFAKEHGGVGFIASAPISPKMDLADIIRNSHVLEYKSKTATVRITIYPNFINTAAGSMVDIGYTIAKKRGES